jgi:hypothetical protein
VQTVHKNHDPDPPRLKKEEPQVLVMPLNSKVAIPEL